MPPKCPVSMVIMDGLNICSSCVDFCFAFIYSVKWLKVSVRALNLDSMHTDTTYKSNINMKWRQKENSHVSCCSIAASRTYIESVWDLQTFFPDGLCCNLTFHLDMEKVSLDSCLFLPPVFHLWHLSEAHHQGFSPGTPVSSPSSMVNGSANKIKLK